MDGGGMDGGPMFGFFLVTMSTALLLPYTIYRLKSKPLMLKVRRLTSSTTPGVIGTLLCDMQCLGSVLV